MTTVRRSIVSTLAMVALSATAALGQDRSRSGTATGAALHLEVVGGYAGFIDEAMIDHAIVGGAARWLVTPRLGTGVEVLFMRGPGEDRDWSVMPTLSWDLRSDGRVVPYLIGGAGWLQTTLEVGTGLYSSSSWTGAAGGGVRIALSPATSLSLEGRIGTEPTTRLTAAFGWRLGKQ